MKEGVKDIMQGTCLSLCRPKRWWMDITDWTGFRLNKLMYTKL